MAEDNETEQPKTELCGAREPGDYGGRCNLLKGHECDGHTVGVPGIFARFWSDEPDEEPGR